MSLSYSLLTFFDIDIWIKLGISKLIPDTTRIYSDVLPSDKSKQTQKNTNPPAFSCLYHVQQVHDQKNSTKISLNIPGEMSQLGIKHEL